MRGRGRMIGFVHVEASIRSRSAGSNCSRRGDIGSGDITAELVPRRAASHWRKVITREDAIFHCAAAPEVALVFRQLQDPSSATEMAC